MAPTHLEIELTITTSALQLTALRTVRSHVSTSYRELLEERVKMTTLLRNLNTTQGWIKLRMVIKDISRIIHRIGRVFINRTLLMPKIRYNVIVEDLNLSKDQNLNISRTQNLNRNLNLSRDQNLNLFNLSRDQNHNLSRN